MYNRGKNLIFLVSQPRAGSTMTQQIIGGHSEIHTQSESWILLHPLHALKPENLMTVYNSDIYSRALGDFIEKMPGGKQYYSNEIGNAFEGFYQSILTKNVKKFFLDKTPRYFHILPELLDIFPDARYIFLWRNPAAVAISILKTWTKNNWFQISEYREDLISAPSLMLEGLKVFGSHAYSLKFEDLVSEPESNIKKICHFLGISYEKDMINYGQHFKTRWIFGDKGTVYEKEKPDSSLADRWKDELNNPQVWRIVNDYIEYLGEKTISAMGYSYCQLQNILHQNKPELDINRHSISLEGLLENPRSALIDVRRLQVQLNQKNEIIRKKDEQILQMGTIQEENTKTNAREHEILIRKEEIIGGLENHLKNQIQRSEEKDSYIRVITEQLQLQNDRLMQQNQEMNLLKLKIEEHLKIQGQAEEQLKFFADQLKNKEKMINIKNDELRKKDEILLQFEQRIKLIYKSYCYRFGRFIFWPLNKITGREF